MGKEAEKRISGKGEYDCHELLRPIITHPYGLLRMTAFYFEEKCPVKYYLLDV
jgi:hypothetical protein